MKFNVEVVRLYGKWLGGLILGGVVSTGKSPWQITSHEWSLIANTVWASAAIVLGAWLNPKHPLTMTVPKE